MSLAFVQGIGSQASSGSVKTISQAFGSTVTAGDLIVVAISNFSPGAVTVQDSVNSVNYTQAVLTGGSNIGAGIFYYVAPVGGASFTVTATSANNGYPGIWIGEFSFTPGDLITLESPAGSQAGSSNAPTTGALTITGTDLIIGAVALAAVETVTAGGGYTLAYSGNYSSGVCEGLAVEYLLNQTTGITPTFGLSGSAAWAMNSVALKAAPPQVLVSLVPYVTKNGLFIVGATNPGGTAVSAVTSLGTSPTLYINGSAATLYGPVWTDVTHDLPIVAWQVTSPSTILDTDVLAYTLPANGINTALGGNLIVGAPGGGTVSVGNNSPTITFTETQTFQSGAVLAFASDLTGGTYTVTNPGTRTVFTITPSYAGTTNGATLVVAQVTNYVGRLEPGFGGCTNFGATPTMPIGINMETGFLQYGVFATTANLRYRMQFVGSGVTYNTPTDSTMPETFPNGMSATFFNCDNINGVENGGGLSGTVNVSNGQPGITFSVTQTLTAGSVFTFAADSTHTPYNVTDPGTGTAFTITPSYAGTTNTATTCTLQGQLGYPTPPGQYVFQWDDLNAGTAGEMQLVLKANSLTTAMSVHANDGMPDTGFPRQGGMKSYSGTNTVTITYANVNYLSVPNLAHGYNMDLAVSVQSTGGLWNSGGTITNFIAVGPGDSIADVIANPLAMPNYMKANLTSPNGNGPASIRPVEGIATGGLGNFQNFSDCQNINAFSWTLAITNVEIPLSYVRFYNTNPALDNVVGNGTYPWPASTKIYSNRLGFDGSSGSATDSSATGTYLDLSARPSLGALSGTVNVTNGQAGITFSVAQTLTSGEVLLFGADTAYGTYNVTNPGTGTAFTITPVYAGTTNGATTCTLQGQNGETDYGQYMNIFAGGVTGYSALEFVSTSPHGLRTGDVVNFPVQGSNTPIIFPIPGGPTTALPNAAVSSGSGTITFASAPSPPLGSEQGLTFGSDTTGQAYWVVPTAGTSGQTVYSIYPNYQGTPSASSTCNLSPVTNINNLTAVVHVTGPTTFALACGFGTGVTTGVGLKGITPKFQVPISVYVTAQTCAGFGPYGLYASHCAQWPGCKLIVPLSPYMTDACLQAIADEIAVNSLADAEILFEFGDEHWNLPGFPAGIAAQSYGRMMAFCPPLQTVNEYYTVPSTPVMLTNDQAYTLILAHQHKVIQAQFDTHNKGLTVGHAFGGFWSGSGVASNMVAFASQSPLGSPSTGGLQQNIPMDYVMLGTYYGNPSTNLSWQNAAMPFGGIANTVSVTNGSPTITFAASHTLASTDVLTFGSDTTKASYTVTNPGTRTVFTITPSYAGTTNTATTCGINAGYWPCTLMLDFLRHDYKYSSSVWAAYTANYDALQNYWGTTKPKLIAYEGQINDYDPNRSNSNDQLTHDCWYSPTNADAFNAAFQSMQDGSPLVPGSGIQLATAYTYAGEWGNASVLSAAWSLYIYQTQVAGAGISNVFTTAQGGSPADGLCHDIANQSVEGQQLANWIQAANAPGGSPTPTPTPTPTPGIAVRPSRIPPGIVSPAVIKLTIVGVGTDFTSGSAVSVQNSVSGTTYVSAVTWTAINTALATLTVTTGPGAGKGVGTWTLTIDGNVSPRLTVAPRKAGWFPGLNRLLRVG